MGGVADEFAAIRDRLAPLGLLHEDSLVMVGGQGTKAVFDASGKLVRADLFERVEAPLAVFGYGEYSLRYAKLRLPLRAFTDDMAQLFGPLVPFAQRPGKRSVATLIAGRGFVATGRYADELVAAAILLEKACRAELLAPALGQLHYLNPAMCLAEHAVYLASYSKHEKEADHER